MRSTLTLCPVRSGTVHNGLESASGPVPSGKSLTRQIRKGEQNFYWIPECLRLVVRDHVDQAVFFLS